MGTRQPISYAFLYSFHSHSSISYKIRTPSPRVVREDSAPQRSMTREPTGGPTGRTPVGVSRSRVPQGSQGNDLTFNFLIFLLDVPNF